MSGKPLRARDALTRVRAVLRTAAVSARDALARVRAVLRTAAVGE